MEEIHNPSTMYYNDDRDLEMKNRQVATMIFELHTYDDFKLPCKLIHCAKMKNKDIEIVVHCSNMRNTDIKTTLHCNSIHDFSQCLRLQHMDYYLDIGFKIVKNQK